MSDHDPLDKVYVQAEAMLDDEAARAARRARVLDAVAEAAPAPPSKRRGFGAAGWLVAASVVGISALVAFQLSVPPVREPSPAETPAPTPPAQAPVTAAPAPPVAPGAPPATTPPSAAATDRAPMIAPADVAKPAPPPGPVAAPPPPPPPPPPPAIASESAIESLAVTGQKRAETMRQAPSDYATAPAAPPPPAPPPANRTAALHAAAAAGRLSEIADLLAQGTPVDALDREGDTALMKAIRARNAAAAALLRRHGASLERTNDAGVSAREMAAAIDDPDLNRALGLEP